MLTTNIDIADRLINGQMGTVILLRLHLMKRLKNQTLYTLSLMTVKLEEMQ